MILLTEVIHNGCKLSEKDLIADLGKTETIGKVFTAHSKAERNRYIGMINWSGKILSKSIHDQ